MSIKGKKTAKKIVEMIGWDLIQIVYYEVLETR